MLELENTIKRKIKNRKFAIENLGLENSEFGNTTSIKAGASLSRQEIDNLFNSMFAHIKEINNNYYLNIYRPIVSNRKAIGPFIVFTKKVIRKLIKITLGWYIFPMMDTQNTFNSNVVNSVNLMKDFIVSLVENDLKKEEIIADQEKLIKDLSYIKEKFDNMKIQNEKLESENKYILNRLNISCDLELLKGASSIDYFKFEDKFRGSRETIKNSQKAYIDYFKENCGHEILDIGCGRGEFLELMRDNQIAARGIDFYEPFVKYCREKGFCVELGDVLTYLNGIEDLSLGGIFMSQVVEHLSDDYILALIKVAYKKLRPGPYFILETPNPETLSTYRNFNIDMGHIKPIHFMTLEYLFLNENYQSVERYNNEFSKYPLEAQHISGNGIDNIEEFNKGIDAINELIFGYRDYALIAKK